MAPFVAERSDGIGAFARDQQPDANRDSLNKHAPCLLTIFYCLRISTGALLIESVEVELICRTVVRVTP